ncbi:MAG TPA: glycosyltransferase [Chitinophagaceae bacterium]
MIIVHVVEPFAAGIAVFVKALTETMPDDLHIVIHGERMNVMSAKEVKKSFPPNVRFIKWKSAQRSINPLKDILALGELYRILKGLKKKNLLDAVHLHSSKSGLLGRVACRLASISNIVYTPNGASFLSAANGFASYVYQSLEKIGNGLGGQVICCSESEYQEYQKIGIPAYFINNGIDMEEDEKEIPLVKNKFRIITSGRIEAQKNAALFNSIAGYFEEFDQFEFIWAGDGKDKKLLTASNIKVTGWLSAAAVKKAVAKADIYISTSLYEGLSFGILEALALQKPVLLSNCVGNKDVIRKGSNGDLFNSKMEAVLKILHYSNNRDMLRVMGSFSQQLCRENFNMQQNFSNYRTVYARNIPDKVMFTAGTKLN